MICGIYSITNTVNNKRYIGYSFNIQQRWNRHRRELKDNKHINKHLQADWNKCKENSFIFEILFENVPKEALTIYETFLISFYSSNKKYFGYNKTNGGDGGNTWDLLDDDERNKRIKKLQEKLSGEKSYMFGRSPSKEECEKISKSLKEYFRTHTVVRSQETKEQISNKLMGHFVSEETRKKQSLAKKGKSRKPMSDNTKHKLSLSRMGSGNPMSYSAIMKRHNCNLEEAKLIHKKLKQK